MVTDRELLLGKRMVIQVCNWMNDAMLILYLGKVIYEI